MHKTPKGPVGRFINSIEETLIALLLGLMTVITFANVIARYVLNTNLLWALEATVFLFAWLVLLGASYVVKISGHLGVDVVARMMSAPRRRVMTLVAAAICIVYALLLLIGSWTYWSPFIGQQAWYEVNDILMPDWLRFIEPIMNEGEPYEKLPRFIPYAALPIGMALLTFRFVQAAWRVWTGEGDLLIASHEAEDMVEEAAGAADREL
ncbi:C4-dicarboxylate TRAP transporter small permease protein DctQ [Defluviimonas aquaemixtae]|uniref:TRAP transporter small permease protein n=1 Tax=Albidovulum aquaemixtae TaxID=1542388 RepID=A0A2R8B6C1_9RHOB|nr:TRAP transporter small permease [Defluviimonas aquaemixtae]SPH18169.1 C4-dicarboxylate TRAP transporter small permease protein DctQ [Defluviimonas aquaemixtae]